MEIDQTDLPARFSSTQPETPINDAMFDWERPALRTIGNLAISSTQPISGVDVPAPRGANHHHSITGGGLDFLSDEPTMSQFASTPGMVPLSLTQHARRFRDIVPAYSLTRFFSHVPPPLLVQMLDGALHALNVPAPQVAGGGGGGSDQHVAVLRVRTADGRKQSLHGDIVVDRFALPHGEGELLEVRFVKVKGDPLEWRRFFKKVALLCRDGIYNSEA